MLGPRLDTLAPQPHHAPSQRKIDLNWEGGWPATDRVLGLEVWELRFRASNRLVITDVGLGTHSLFRELRLSNAYCTMPCIQAIAMSGFQL